MGEGAENVRYYCAECFEEAGNCPPWCSAAERERERNQNRTEPEPDGYCQCGERLDTKQCNH